jgi:hypothetical protein
MVLKNFLIVLALSATSVASQVLPVSAYGFTDFIKDQANNFQDRFISTQFNQKFVQDMSNDRLNEFKKEYGDRGYVPYVDAWCGDQIYAQGYYNRLSKVIGRNGIINGAVATWRFEDGKVNCYFRYQGDLK